MDRQDRDSIYATILAPEILRSFSQRQLWTLIKALSHERKVRYVRHRQRKYGNLNKGFSHLELRAFFSTPLHPKARLAFLTMLCLGLRVGEVVKIKRSNLDLDARRLYVHTEKAGTHDSLYLHDAILEPLLDWLEEHETSITEHKEYIFFSDYQKEQRFHISPNWLRKEFRTATIAAGIDRSYAVSEERAGREQRNLHRLTTHSLRHTFATTFYRKTKDLLLTSRALRHTDMKSTTTYVHADQTELDAALSTIFS